MKQITLKLPEDIYLLLREYAGRRNMTVSEVIRRALIQYLTVDGQRSKDAPYYGRYIKVTLGEKIAAQ